MELQWIIVQSGDTLSRIASAHHMTRALLAALNPEAAAQPTCLLDRCCESCREPVADMLFSLGKTWGGSQNVLA